MDIFLKKVIRPTQLQPKLFSIVNSLARKNDYKVVINKDNKPLCVMMSYSLVESIDLEGIKARNDNKLIEKMRDYYSSLSEDETSLLNDAVDDGI